MYSVLRFNVLFSVILTWMLCIIGLLSVIPELEFKKTPIKIIASLILLWQDLQCYHLINYQYTQWLDYRSKLISSVYLQIRYQYFYSNFSTCNRHLERNRGLPWECSQHVGANRLCECHPARDPGVLSVSQPKQKTAACPSSVRRGLFSIAVELAASCI